MESENKLLVIITTVGSKDHAKNLGRQLVEAQLVACVQLDEIESIYSWKEEVQEDREIRLMIKLLPKHLNETVEFIRQHHPYDTPELIQATFTSDQKYLEWCQSVSK